MDNDISQIILDELRAHRLESADRHDKLDGRVRNVEAWQHDAGGKATMLASVAAALGGIVVWATGFFHK